MKFSTNEKKAVAYSFIFILSVVFLMGFVMERQTQILSDENRFVAGAPIELAPLDSFSSDSSKLKAMLKGSIYETGENMTVYGACFDGDGYLLPDADAYFTAWYPNGTISTGPNATMDMVQDDWRGFFLNGTGRWKIHVTMYDTLGTYLTEIRCEYEGDWAVAYGEWQNPDWVRRISETHELSSNMSNLLTSVSQNITEFRYDVDVDFNNVLNAINSISSDSDQSLMELSEQLRAVDRHYWVLDDNNPFYLLASGEHNWQAVDMLSPSRVAAVSSDGYFALWDGESWTEILDSGIEWRGVSILPANAPYAWAVGTNGSDMLYSINGAVPQVFPNLGPFSGTALNDVVLFQDPNTPSGDWFGYLLDDYGQVYYTNDSGSSWTYIDYLDVGSRGRFSQVVANYGSGSQPEGFLVMAIQGSSYGLFNGVNSSTTSVTGQIRDASLLYHNLGYFVVDANSSSIIYMWDGSSHQLMYEIEDASIVPTAIEAHASNDVWVATTDPAVFYHFNGVTWEYSSFGYSQFVSVIINFGSSGNSSVDGIQDMRMFDSRNGYAVGQDGIILVFRGENQLLLQSVKDMISDMQFNFSLDLNATELALETSLQNLTSIVTEMNLSLSADLDALAAYLVVMNASLDSKADYILANVTYTNLYLESMVFPFLNDTYQNTLEILYRLGILEAQINQTIELQNQTLNIVNQTASDVDELVDRSRRIRAWITQ